MKIVIAGAGSAGISLAQELSEKNYEIVLIDKKNKTIITELTTTASNVKFLLGDVTTSEFLQNSELQKVKAAVATTGDDKTNLVFSQLAKQELGAEKVIARINNPKNEWLFNEAWGIDKAVSIPKLLTTFTEDALESGELIKLMDLSARISLVSYTIPSPSEISGKTIQRLDLTNDYTISAVVRGEKILPPTDNLILEDGDRIIFVVDNSHLNLLYRKLSLTK